MEPRDCPSTDGGITNLLVRTLAHLAFVCFLHSRQRTPGNFGDHNRIGQALFLSGDSPLAFLAFGDPCGIRTRDLLDENQIS